MTQPNPQADRAGARGKRTRGLLQMAAIAASYLALATAAFFSLPRFDFSSVLRTELLVATVAAALMFALSVVLVGIRNGVVLKLKSSTLRFTIFGAAISLALNFFLPFRLGDAVRVVFLRRHCKVNLVAGASSMGLERAIDLTIMGIVFLIAVVAGAFTFLQMKYNPGIIAALTALPLVCLFGAVVLLRSRTAQRFALVRSVRDNLAHLSELEFWTSTGGTIAFLSVAIWLVNFAAIAIFFALCEPDINVMAVAAMVLVGVNLAIAFPVTPGAMGVFQAVCVTILAGAGVGFERSFAEGVMLQLSIVALSILATIPILVSHGIGLSQIRDAIAGRRNNGRTIEDENNAQ